MLKSLFSLFQSSAVSISQMKRQYYLPPSLGAYLPWVEYDQVNQCFLLNDQTVAAVFELSDLPSEARPQHYFQQLRDGLQGIFQLIYIVLVKLPLPLGLIR